MFESASACFNTNSIASVSLFVTGSDNRVFWLKISGVTIPVLNDVTDNIIAKAETRGF
jgi:hypothetical protein